MHLSKRWLVALLPFLLALACTWAGPNQEGDSIYYGVEINGVLCGYAKLDTTEQVLDGRRATVLDHELFLMISALGSKFNSEIDLTYHIDPESGDFFYHDSEIRQGPVHMTSEIHVRDGKAHFTSSESDGEEVTELPDGVVLENTLYFPHLVRDLVDAGRTEKTYEMYEVREGEVQETTVSLVGREEIELAGKTFDAIVVDRLNQVNGVKYRAWLDVTNGQLLKADLPGSRKSFLTDASVVKKIQVADLDSSIIVKVDTAIADIHAINYMKVRAEVEPTGLWVTPDGLNVAGQKFDGTVEENLVEGVFEIEHRRYDGTGAYAFPPPDFRENEALAEYLEPSMLLESDDPAIASKARELTAGAPNSWEAVRHISRWVADSIQYAIPGGGSASRVLETRTGECGGHSLLVAAMCRSVGIPARVVWGCMYVPNYGGGFGQHAWNEIWMGEEAGWIPLDATANETDFVDSGHIRIGEYRSMTTGLHPVSAEVLAYRVGDGPVVEVGAGAAAAQPVPDSYRPFVGSYKHPQVDRVMTVLYKDGSLTIDIPNQVMLALNDPDEAGSWYAKLSDKVYVTFGRDEAGAVASMTIHELVSLRRTGNLEEIGDDVPENYRKYLGVYLLPQLGAKFKVVYEDDSLAVDDPLAKQVIGLQHPDDRGRWLDEFGKNHISFEVDDAGAVTSMIIDSASKFVRQP